MLPWASIPPGTALQAVCPEFSAPPVARPPVADHTLARLPRAAWSKPFRACGVGTGVEPVTARFTVWCSTTELTSLDTTIGQNPSAEHTSPTALLKGQGSVRRWPGRIIASKEAPVGVEPTSSCFAGSRRAVWLQRQFIQTPRRGIEPRLADS